MKCVWTKLEALPDPQHGRPCARSSHGLSACLQGQKLILYGGEHVARTPLDSNQAAWALVRNSSDKENSWQWHRLVDDGPSPRIAQAQAVHNDKIVYIFGGRAGITMSEQALNDLWTFNAGTETWHQVMDAKGTPPEPRSFHKMTCVGDSLYVFGGCGADGRLNDLHRFDIRTNTWHDLGKSHLLKGRGGANLLVLDSGKSLAVVAGFAGEETADGQRYDLVQNKWDDQPMELTGMRPRSVCVSGSFPSKQVSVIFGGEVDPSDRGHEGAGCFEKDMVVLHETTGTYLKTIKSPPEGDASFSSWPEARGWSDAAIIEETGQMFLFGGLSGDDSNPRRLDDSWRCDISE